MCLFSTDPSFETETHTISDADLRSRLRALVASRQNACCPSSSLANAKRRPSNARSSLSRTTSPSTPTYISKDGGPYRYVQHRDPQRSRVQGQGHGHGRLRVRTPARASAGKITNVAIATPAASPPLPGDGLDALARPAVGLDRPDVLASRADSNDGRASARVLPDTPKPRRFLPPLTARRLQTPSTVASRSSSRRSRCPVSCP